MINSIKCPYCGININTTDWTEYGGHDGDMFDHECGNCKSTFEAITIVQVKYKVVGMLGDDQYRIMEPKQ